jgi:HEAT repeat protein
LSRATTGELVRALESPHGWWRDTAHRLFFERQDKSSIPALEQLVRHSRASESRVHALWSLQGLQALNNDVLAAGLADTHAGVRENAIRLAEPRLDASAELRGQVRALISDPAPRVRLQVAFAIGECRKWHQAALLARLARENVADPWMQSAILSSAAACGGELFGVLAADARWRADSASLEFLRQLGLVIGAQNRRNEVAQTIEQLARWESLDAVFPVASALAEGLKRAGTSLAAVDVRNRLKPLFQQAKSIVSNTTLPRAVRRAAIEALGLLPYADAAPALLGLLERAVRWPGKAAGEHRLSE